MKNNSYVFISILLILSLISGCSKKAEVGSNVKLRLPYFSDVRNKPVGEELINRREIW